MALRPRRPRAKDSPPKGSKVPEELVRDVHYILNLFPREWSMQRRIAAAHAAYAVLMLHAEEMGHKGDKRSP